MSATAGARARAFVVGWTLALTAGCGTPGGFRDLDSIDSLKAAFAADEGHVRLVLLLSPT
jgi:hypothetical protein